jgi:hypothetical protein
MTAAGERALYSVAYWLRRGDTQAVDDLVGTLDEAERVEARELYLIDGVPRALYEMPEPELLARMFELAGKSRAVGGVH